MRYDMEGVSAVYFLGDANNSTDHVRHVQRLYFFKDVILSRYTSVKEPLSLFHTGFCRLVPELPMLHKLITLLTDEFLSLSD